jgi:hypothetical protein
MPLINKSLKQFLPKRATDCQEGRQHYISCLLPCQRANAGGAFEFGVGVCVVVCAEIRRTKRVLRRADDCVESKNYRLFELGIRQSTIGMMIIYDIY